MTTRVSARTRPAGGSVSGSVRSPDESPEAPGHTSPGRRSQRTISSSWPKTSMSTTLPVPAGPTSASAPSSSAAAGAAVSSFLETAAVASSPAATVASEAGAADEASAGGLRSDGSGDEDVPMALVGAALAVVGALAVAAIAWVALVRLRVGVGGGSRRGTLGGRPGELPRRVGPLSLRGGSASSSRPRLNSFAQAPLNCSSSRTLASTSRSRKRVSALEAAPRPLMPLDLPRACSLPGLRAIPARVEGGRPATTRSSSPSFPSQDSSHVERFLSTRRASRAVNEASLRPAVTRTNDTTTRLCTVDSP